MAENINGAKTVSSTQQAQKVSTTNQASARPATAQSAASKPATSASAQPSVKPVGQPGVGQTIVKPGETTTTTETRVIRPGVTQTITRTRTTSTSTTMKPVQPTAAPASQPAQSEPKITVKAKAVRPLTPGQKLVAFFKNKFVLFALLLIIMGVSVFFLLLADEKNMYRPDWMNTWFFQQISKIFGTEGLNVEFRSWLFLFVIWFVVLLVFSLIFLRKPSKEVYARKHNLDVDNPDDKKKFRKFNAIYYLLFLAATALICGLFFGLFPYGEMAKNPTADPAGPLVNVFKSCGLFIVMMLIIPLCILLLVLIFKLLILLLSLIIGNVSKSVMASENYQEASAASQLAAEKIRQEVAAQREREAAAGGQSSAQNAQGGQGNGAQSGMVNGMTAQAIAASAAAGGNSTLGGHQLNMFPALTKIDRFYGGKAEVERTITEKIDLIHLTNGFQSFLANQKHLYYGLDMLRAFIAGMACSRLLLLQGLSGTGKTSLPREFANYTRSSATFYPVQATWRDKSDLVGYFSDFTGEYKETELLKTLYRARYTAKTIYLLVLDEANISRMEYYFADFLSVYEYPSSNWLIPLIQPRRGDRLPLALEEGKVRIPVNTWFVATCNVDDSTFTISDKVYDRAMVLDFSALNEPIKTNYTDTPYPMTKGQFEDAVVRAKDVAKNCLNAADKAKFMKLLEFVGDTFDCKIGNRIMNQIDNFVPVFVACGGTKEAALDVMFANKVLRKVDALFESYVEDGLNKLTKLVNSVYGAKNFPITMKTIAKIKKKFN